MSEPTGHPDTGRRASASDPEVVLAQALRVMAGGRAGPSSTGSTSPRPATGLTTAQVLLIAAIIGLLVGAGIALLQLAG